MFELTDTQKIGVGLSTFGIFFIFLGVLLLLDRSLLALGNILFISGLVAIIGRQRTFLFFFQRHKAKRSIAFFGGIILVLLKWPLVGMLLELYGFFLLFSDFFPIAINFLRRIPILGTVLNFPGISMLVDRITGDANRTRV
ncbi:vesicle transport protein GOT1B [Diabrotica virgifera virgifera]|uniref:Vesicle transport protein GOT1B n=1 Tax=Diabrotica virgifera virgifera TaxID=50390 RepID=A0A6P7FZF0_DIAVI|nr:vesicle transport protein GOT1B [Diabrotica virgifera virgifera]